MAAVGSVAISAIVYYGVKLEGTFLVFWLTYFATLCVGICEPPPPPPCIRCCCAGFTWQGRSAALPTGRRMVRRVGTRT